MISCPKELPFRCQKLLDLAAKAPHCFNCKAPNRGQVVACHSNKLRYGKGMGTKAHDLPAMLCGVCHDLLDGRIIGWTPEQREAKFFICAYETWLWLMQSGHLEVRK